MLIANVILTATGFPRTTEILSTAKPGLDRKILNLNLGIITGCPSEGPSLTPTLLAQILWPLTQGHPSLGAVRHVHHCQQNPDNWTSLVVQWLRICLPATWEARNGKYCLVNIKRPFSSYKYFILLLLLSRFSRVQLCNPIDGSPPGSSVPGILQARTLEWVAISFSNACMHAKLLQLCLTLCDPMTAVHQAPLSTGFSRQEYWNGLPFPSPYFILKIVI